MTDAARRPLRLVPQAPAAPCAPRRAPTTALIGRDDLLARVVEEVGRGTRIITLLGPPGIGKTRLAHACLERLGAGWFCDLTQTTSEPGLGFAVLSALKGRAEGERVADGDAIAHVGDVLRSMGPTLLVLDNFEQLAFAAKTVERWCADAPALTIVVTSRERLAVAGEVVVELPPLAHADAGALFLRRARDAGGTAADGELVASLVRRLEGIPLAIELAAARTRLMSVEELDRRLGEGHRVLAPSTRATGRHATLESAIAWSWDLLPREEQIALARCSVFAGGFSLDMAEHVVGDGALTLLGALRDKSLVHADADGRLALYVSLRDFAGRKLALEPGGSAKAQHAHARAYAELATRFNAWHEMLERVPDARVSDLTRREKDNIVAAIAFVRTVPFEPKLRAHLVVAAAQIHAMPAEACLTELSDALLGLGEGDVVERALVLFARQSVRASLGSYDAALEDLASLAATPGLPHALVLLAHAYEGIQLRHYGRPRDAWEQHEIVRVAAGHEELPRIAAMNAACMGRLAFDLEDAAGSRRLNGEALSLADAVDDRWVGALALANLAQLEQEEQRFERAQELLGEALDRLRHVSEVYEAVYSSACGDLFFEWGKYEDARRWYAEGARFYRASMRTHRVAALASASAAALEAHDGEHARAAELASEARRIAVRANNGVVEACVDLHAASVEVLGAVGEERAAVIERWRAKLAGYGASPVVRTCFEARFALRIARRMLERASVVATLRVERQGRWFEVGGKRVELGRRGALRRILAALATANRDQGLKQSDLAAAGWPGERVLVEAAATRVRVAIATLRQLGLRAHLVTRDDGYVLERGADLEVCD